jgi:hypothetical protein
LKGGRVLLAIKLGRCHELNFTAFYSLSEKGFNKLRSFMPEAAEAVRVKSAEAYCGAIHQFRGGFQTRNHGV